MRKVFPIFAVLMATMLAVWMLGCGDGDVPCEIEVTLKSTNPADGGKMFANGTLIIEFDGGAASNVTVNDNDAGNGAKVTWKATGLDAEVGKQATLTIKWEYCTDTDEPKSGEASITVTVEAEDTVPPAIADSSPGDGDKDLDPAKLAEDGITVNFTEPVTVKSGNVYFQVGDDDPISWLVEPTADGTGIELSIKGGNDLPFESEIVLKMDKVTDGAGNEADLEITFSTQAKE
jgi:hypothetical protein